jgi:serine protease Do
MATLLLALALLAPAAEAATRWGWLGVRIRDLSEQEMEEISQRFGLREGFGAVIVEVINETPAAAAGLRTGDLVVAFSDRPVVDTRSL